MKSLVFDFQQQEKLTMKLFTYEFISTNGQVSTLCINHVYTSQCLEISFLYAVVNSFLPDGASSALIIQHQQVTNFY